MHAICCQAYGPPESLVFIDVPEPGPAPGEVIIQVKACGVNFPDLLIIQNKYQFKPPLPFSPGGEVAGIVTAVGGEVKQFHPGDRVVALCGWGGFAEKVAVKASRVFPISESLDFVDAASTLYTYGTSYYALKDRATLKAGETLLVLGAAGGVGLAAVELGKLMGASVIAAASSDSKLAICKAKGADYVINYSTSDIRTVLKKITNDKGVDIVFDPVGGSLAEPALRSIAWRGRYLVVGFASGVIPSFPANLPLLKGAAIVGVFWGSFSEREPGLAIQNLNQLVQWMEQGKIKQHIHQIYPLEQAAQALRDLQNRVVVGKAVVQI